jgi:hypothetical protein
LRLKDEKEDKIARFRETYRQFRCFTRTRLSHFCQCSLSEHDPEPKSDGLLDRLLFSRALDPFVRLSVAAVTDAFANGGDGLADGAGVGGVSCRASASTAVPAKPFDWPKANTA